MVNSKSAAILLGWCIAQQTASAFIPSTAMNGKNAQWTQLSASSNDDSNMDSMSRRELWTKTSAAAAAAFSVALNPNAAFAATKPPTEADLARIKKGYDGIEYLLANWEKETTVCRENGGECKRDAEPVRRYMGLRSTTDPLFQIEKVFDKVKYMDDIDIDDLEPFFAATEDWNTAVNMSNSMAFISQFGEYNPGGGKEEVLKYLNESQKQVIIAQKALKTIMDILKL